MTRLNRKSIPCIDPLPALLRWADSYSHAAFLITSRDAFSAGVGLKKGIEIRSEFDRQYTRAGDFGGRLRIAGAENAFDSLQSFQRQCEEAVYGFLGYDLKNDLENLSSGNPDKTAGPDAAFFEPEIELSFSRGVLTLKSRSEKWIAEAESALKLHPIHHAPGVDVRFDQGISREEYLEGVKAIRKHLQRGDIYEVNYCMGFTARASSFEPVEYFLLLQAATRAPFSVFARLGKFYILSASPERFLKNTGGKLISQPIKGTIKRDPDPNRDEALKTRLRNDLKEQNENVMIVDLVRNDLSRIAMRDSVRVEKLFDVETFPTVHHLVSTISARLDSSRFSHWDAIRACFPMGSMTGVPKISAMKIIDVEENFRRGAYSGAFGRMEVNGNFDFNVLIRSVFYNSGNHHLSIGVGSAITMLADPESEYRECLLKAEALLAIFNQIPSGAAH